MAAVLTQLLPSRRSRSQTQQQRAFIKEAGIDSDMLERDDEIIAASKRAAVQKEEAIEEAKEEIEEEAEEAEEAEEEAEEEVEEEAEEEATKEAEETEEDSAPQESDTVDVPHASDGDEGMAQQEDVSAEAGNVTSGLSSDGEDSGRPDHKRRRTQRNEHHPKRRRISAGISDAELAHKTDGEDVAESGSSAADESSSEVEQWEEASEGQEVVENEAADVVRCMFCHETEENDPGEEFEEILTCVVCGDSAHRQCARDEDMFANDNDASHWCCSKCVHEENEYDDAASHASDDTMSGQRRNSAPKFARDLLPAQNGSIKEGSHSIFNNLILHDDPMDGSRSLRKRKASGESDTADLVNETRKRLRRSSARPPEEALETVDSDDEDEGPAPKIQDFQISRSRRQRPARIPEEPLEQEPLARVTLDGEGTLMMCFKVDRYALGHIRDEYRKRRKRERERDRQKRLREGRQQTTTTTTTTIATAPTQTPGPIRSGLVEPAHYPSIQVSNIATPFLALHDREGEGERSKPYGGILTEKEASTEHTFPEPVDRKKFEDARQRAEELWRKKVEAANLLDQNRTNSKLAGPPSRIKCISFGNYEIDTWHAAPYPEEYSRNRVLYICEFCLKYLNSDFVAWRHKLKCPARHPPGDEIYSDGNFSFFEVDGRKNPVYCQNLCLLAKLFLGSKTLYYDVEPFLFYVMTENDDKGCHFVGYFSKEKRPSSQNNVSCILVLPIHQRRGFGHYLIDFSYLLTRVEKKTGSPEKPLSDMGLVSYRSYWRLVMCYQLRDQASKVSISDISDRTGMTADDIVSALEGLRALVRDPVTKTYALRLDLPYFRKYIEDYEKKGYPKIVPEALVWVPYVMGRDNMHYESGAPLHTVAQREDLEDAIEAAEGADEGLLAQSGVAEKDYATKSNGLVHTTSLVADADTEHPPAPFPPIDAADDALDPPRTPNGHTADSSEEASIPPHRFEVFPPVPGSAARRRPGRPFGSRTHKRHAPRAWPFADTPEKAATGATRPADRAVDGTLNGTGHGEVGVTSPASAGVASPPSRMSARRTRSSVGTGEFGEHVDGTEGQGVLTGSPLKRVNGAGKVEQDVGVEGGESAEDAVDVVDASLA